MNEESRDDKNGRRYGFDHVILKWAEATDLVPLRLPYFQRGEDVAPQPKKEAEFGVDFKFISRDGKKLYVFVLKDERLTYGNFTSEKFDKDLRLAANQDLTIPGHTEVDEVKIILCYNKGEMIQGVDAYDSLVKTLGTKVGDTASLTFERWNLTILSEKVLESLSASPALLPERFFRKFTYICWQVGDFHHGSEHWESILIPDWIEFLDEILVGEISETEVRMVSIALLILKSHGVDDPSWETGWIEILEYAMLALWRAASANENHSIHPFVLPIWNDFYLAELHAYYERNSALLASHDSLTAGYPGEFSEVIGCRHAYWHMGRLGILAGSLIEFSELACEEAQGELPNIEEKLEDALETWVGMINANPSVLRPLLDIHHIELFLFWSVFRRANRRDKVVSFFRQMIKRLIIRRSGHGGIRLIDQGNSWERLLERIAISEAAEESVGKTSYLLQMILEICVGDLGEEGRELAVEIFQHLILGKIDDEKSHDFPESVELQSWVPPEAWGRQVLAGYTGDLGITLTINSYFQQQRDNMDGFSENVLSFIQTARETHPVDYGQDTSVPAGVWQLACILHKSPVPPEFWRIQCESVKNS
ncbi:MAG: hypothetical protein P1U58_10950 [Verrucomicrobiales bacterium]|nr:hypothetical protein [Verrucomicrobiales bacterium]